MTNPLELLAQRLAEAKDSIRTAILDEIDTEEAKTAILRLMDRHPDQVAKYQRALDALK